MTDERDTDAEWITPKEASRLLGLSEVWVRSFMRFGDVRIRPDDRISREDVEAIAARLRRGAGGIPAKVAYVRRCRR